MITMKKNKETSRILPILDSAQKSKISDIVSLKKKIVPILKEHNVTKAGIFGSYARGEQKKKSDVDILVEVGKNMGLLEFIGLKLKIEEAVKKKVDLVEYETIRWEIENNILRDEIPIIR